MMLEEILQCRSCGFKKLTPILSFGSLYVSDFIDAREEERKKYPLELVLCNHKDGGCGLLQLKHTVPPATLYRNYWYRSGMNKTMTNELAEIVKKIKTLVQLERGDSVIDIGANDGTLLRAYEPGLVTVGFEPAQNLKEYNQVGTTKIINNFFNFPAWHEAFGSKKAKAITAIAMFYDLENPNEFLADVAKCLDPNGVFIIQMSYLPLMLAQNAFDNICHEHLEYYSLLSLENLLQRHQLEVFGVELNQTNGGSFRAYIRHKGKGEKIAVPEGAEARVLQLRSEEDKLGLHDRKIYDEFVARVHDAKEKLTEFIKKEVARGKKVFVYGASTKGNTLLQYYDLDTSLIEAAAERNPDKWGKKTVGTLIPIISEDEARSRNPDYFLVLPWHFLEEFMERERAFIERGGKFIVPLPTFKIVS